MIKDYSPLSEMLKKIYKDGIYEAFEISQKGSIRKVLNDIIEYEKQESLKSYIQFGVLEKYLPKGKEGRLSHSASHAAQASASRQGSRGILHLLFHRAVHRGVLPG